MADETQAVERREGETDEEYNARVAESGNDNSSNV